MKANLEIVKISTNDVATAASGVCKITGNFEDTCDPEAE